MPDSRSITRFLQAHFEIDQVDYDLDMALRLHGPTHYAEAQPRQSVPHGERRDDRMERSFVRLQTIAMFRVE